MFDGHAEKGANTKDRNEQVRLINQRSNLWWHVGNLHRGYFQVINSKMLWRKMQGNQFCLPSDESGPGSKGAISHPMLSC